MPVSSSGYYNESLEKTKERIANELKSNLGNDVILNKPGGVMSSINNVLIAEAQNYEEGLKNSLISLTLDTATGSALDSIAQIAGFSRIAETRSVGFITFYGNIGVIIPVNTLVSSTNGIVFKTLETIVMTKVEEDVQIQCTIYGIRGNLASDTITILNQAIPGIDKINNNEPTFGGGLQETDEELRQRIKNVQIDDIGSTSFLIQKLYLVDGVNTVNYFENLDIVPQGNIPALSSVFVIGGGLNQDIGEVFYNYSAVPFRTFGDVRIDVPNDFGRYNTYYIYRPNIIAYYFKLTINLIDITNKVSSNFRYEVNEEIKNYVEGLDIGRSFSGDEIIAGFSDKFVKNYSVDFNLIKSLNLMISKDNIDYVENIISLFMDKPMFLQLEIIEQ